MKKAKKKAAKRLEKEERKRLKKEERKRLKKVARKLEKRKLSAAKDSGSSDMDVDIDNSIDETNSAISTTNSNEQSPPPTYITTSNTNQNQILQLIPNHIKSNYSESHLYYPKTCRFEQLKKSFPHIVVMMFGGMDSKWEGFS